MKHRMAMISTCLLLAGCAGQHTKLGNEDRAALATQPLHAVDYGPMGFHLESSGYTAAAVIFSPLVVVGQMAEGRELQEDLKLQDPVGRVKDRLVRGLQANFNITDVRAVTERPAQNNPESLRKAFGSGIVLEVNTRKWGIDNNRAKYSAQARLTRLPDATVLWEAACNEVVADKDKPSPSRDALRANGGELLKAKLNEAADACADQLVAWAAGKDR